MDSLAPSLGLLFILLGAGVMYGGTTAFDSTDGDRTASVSVTGDATAYLALEGTDAATTPSFTNLFDSDMTLTVDTGEPTAEFDPGASGSWVDPPYTTTLSSGEVLEIGMRADPDEVTVDIQGDVESGGVQLSRAFEVQDAGLLDGVQGSVTVAGGSGQYEFELQNTGTEDVAIDGIAVDDTTNPDAVEVSNGDYLTAEGVQVVDETVEVGGHVVDFTQTVDVPAGEAMSFEFDRFQEPTAAGSPHADMQGEDVTITIRATDGSTATLTLESD